jgi:transcriptional regulator with XRE-family HTH domain
MTKRSPGAQFGQEVRRRRAAGDITLEVLAGRAGLTPNFVGTIENGRRDPSLSTVLSIAKALGVAPAELFSSTGTLTVAAEEAARLFDEAPREVRKAVLSILRSLRKRRRRRAALAALAPLTAPSALAPGQKERPVRRRRAGG